MEGTNKEITETPVEKIPVQVSSSDQPKIKKAQSELDGSTLQNIGFDSNRAAENQIVRATVTAEQQTSMREVMKHNDISGNSGLALTYRDSLMHNSIIKWNQGSFLILPGPPAGHTSSFDLGGTNGNLPANIQSFSQASGPSIGGNYIYVNAKQYKRIIRRRKIRKFKNAKRGKLAALLPKPIPQTPNSAREGEQSLRPTEISETTNRFDNIRDFKGKWKTDNSQVINTVEDGMPNNYSPTRTPMTWYPDIFVNDLVTLKERVWALEERSQIESITMKRVTEDNWKLAAEVKSLREQMQKLQFNLEKGEYELILLKKEVGEKRTATSAMGEGEATEGDKNPQMKNIQEAMANMEIKENQLREQIEEVRSWANIVRGPANTPIDNIEKQVRRQFREEKERNEKATNIVIKGLRDYGEQEKTTDLVKDFFKDQLDWHGTTVQAQRIGKWIRGGKDRHVRVTMRNIGDKNNIFSKRKFLRGTHIYFDDDLTIIQQEERRKEWEKVKTARENGKWAWLQNGKAQISDKITHNK